MPLVWGMYDDQPMDQLRTASASLRSAAVHTDWAHFTEGGHTLPAAFERAGLSDVLHVTPPGVTVHL